MAKKQRNIPVIPQVELLQPVHHTSAGTLYRAREASQGDSVLAFVLEKPPEGRDASESLRRGAQAITELNHPNIVAYHDVGTTTENQCYVVFEHVEGPNLEEFIRERGPLLEKQALRLLRHIASALQAAQRKGIVHGDLRPESIVLQRAPSDDHDEHFPYIPKVTGFNLLHGEPSEEEKHHPGETPLTITTPAYMAPEQFDDEEGWDFRADIHGLGCLLYFILTGEHPYDEDSISKIAHDKHSAPLPDPRHVNPTIRPETVLLLHEMLASTPQERPGSYNAIREACDRLSRELPEDTLTKWQQESRVRLVAFGVALGLLLAVQFIYLIATME